jgi:hypothetical protein
MPGPSDAERISALLRERLARITAEAVARDGHVDEAELVEIERLVRLKALVGSGRRRTLGVRSFLGVLLGLLLLFTILHGLRVATTEIELDALASGVGFKLASSQLLTDAAAPVRIVELGIGGPVRAAFTQGPAGRRQPAGPWPPVVQAPVRFASEPVAGASMTLDLTELPRGTIVTVSETIPPRQYRLSLLAPVPTDVNLTIDGPVQILSGEGARRVSTRRPQGVTLEIHGRTAATFELTLADGVPFVLRPLIGIHSLELSRWETLASPSMAAQPLRVSTLAGRALYLEALAGKRVEIRRGEGLILTGADGVLHALKAGPEGLSFTFRGTVSDLSTGTDLDRRTLMPSWLEWLEARHPLKIVWAAAGLLASLAAARLSWGRSVP